MSDAVERRLAAILSADAVGYSSRMAEDEVAAVDAIRESRGEIARIVSGHRGRVVDTPGDNLLAEFPSATDALGCALEIQRELAQRNVELPKSRGFAFRIGVHVGEILAEGDRIYGDGVNVAARLEGIAPEGGICVSAAARDQVSPRLVIDFEDMGEQQLKNIPRPVRAYRVSAPEVASQPQKAADERPFLVVLPFANMSGEPEQEYFSDGITEDLITDLSKLSGMAVIARTSAFAYKERNVPIAQIAKELGVRYVIEGSVRRSGERIRVTAQLVDASSGAHLWAERYDRRLEDTFSVQDELVQEIIRTLRLQIAGGDRVGLKRSPTRNLEAYDHLLRARSYGRRFTRETIDGMRREANRVLELDPECVEAWAILADTYGAEWALQLDPNASVEQVEEFGHKAIELDPTNAWPHWVLGMAYRHSGRLSEALIEARTAVALDPDLPDAHHLLGHALTQMGRAEEALSPLEHALRLDPHRWETQHYRAAALLALGRLREAGVACERALELWPESPDTRLLLALVLAESGNERRAREALGELRERFPRLQLQRVLRRVGRPADLARFLGALEELGPID